MYLYSIKDSNWSSAASVQFRWFFPQIRSRFSIFSSVSIQVEQRTERNKPKQRCSSAGCSFAVGF